MKFFILLFFISCFFWRCTNTNQNTNETIITDSMMINDSSQTIVYWRKLQTNYIEKYEDGTPYIVGEIKNNLKDGVWKIFGKKGELQAVKLYYNDSLLFDLDPLDFSYREVNINKKEISVLLPFNWETKLFTKEESNVVIFTSEKRCLKDDLFCPNITFTYEILNVDSTFEEYLRASYKLIENTFSDFKLVAQGDVSSSSITAYQITYLMTVDEVKLGGVTTWIYNSESNSVYCLTGLALNQENSEFLKYKVLFQEISNSIYFL